MSGSFQIDPVFQVLGLFRGMASVRLLLVSKVGSSQTCVRMAIQSVWVWSARGLAQHETCVFVGLLSSIDRVA